VSTVSRIEIRTQEEADREEEQRRLRLMQALQAQHVEAQSALLGAEAASAPPQPQAGAGSMLGLGGLATGVASPFAGAEVDANATFIRQDRKVGRNEPCPCGSGKKFKHCHGALTGAD
jgi:preprotein translocase subunit SecA